MIRSVADLQAMVSGDANRRYAIATAIDASETATWNSGAGFVQARSFFAFDRGADLKDASPV